MNLILVRHGETDGNGARHVGREDLPLNAAGQDQAMALGRALAVLPVTAVLASPLSRAADTAAAVARPHGLPVTIRDGLMEIDFGALQGTAKGEAPFRLRKDWLTTPMPGGESLADVWTRLAPVAGEIAERASGGLVVAVGHYWSNRLLLARLRGMVFEAAAREKAYRPATGSALGVVLPGADPATSRWLATGGVDSSLS